MDKNTITPVARMGISDLLRSGRVRSFEGISLQGMNFQEANLEGTTLNFVNLYGMQLQGANLRNATLEHVNLAAADLTGAHLQGCTLRQVSFGSANMAGVVLDGSQLEACDFTACDLTGASLKDTAVRSCILERAILKGADFSGTKLNYSQCNDADFEGANFKRCESLGGSFHGASFKNAIRFYQNREMVTEVLEQSIEGDLERARYTGAIRILKGWCWDAWQQIFLAASPSVKQWICDVFDAYDQSGCREMLLPKRKAEDRADQKSLFRVFPSSFLEINLGTEKFAAVLQPGQTTEFSMEQLKGLLLEGRLSAFYPDFSKNEVELLASRLDPDQRLALWQRMMAGADLEITSPFQTLAKDGEPETLGADEWDQLSESDITAMDRRESHIRGEIAAHIDDLPTGAVVLDPACSSGACLHSASQRRADLKIVGYDLSPRMIERCRALFSGNEQVTLEMRDACQLIDLQVDLCILRCLGHFITTPQDASQILQNCLRALKPGGKLIVTGTSPLYVTRSGLEEMGLRLLQTVARLPQENVMFPFYVCVKPEQGLAQQN